MRFVYVLDRGGGFVSYCFEMQGQFFWEKFEIKFSRPQLRGAEF
jgi:hypothetical protein